jgi:hypothetical protein
VLGDMVWRLDPEDDCGGDDRLLFVAKAFICMKPAPLDEVGICPIVKGLLAMALISEE